MPDENLTVPPYLFHASPECAHDSIKEKGLIGSMGDVYACEDPHNSLRFMGFRLLDHYHWNPSDPDPAKTAKIVKHDHIDVWVIDTSKTDLSKWEISMDHSPQFFGTEDSFVYWGQIPPEALVECKQFAPKEESNEHAG